MKQFDLLANAKRWLPLFVLAAGVIVTVRFLEWQENISVSQGTYVETAIWIGIYLVVLNQFRKVDFRSRYFRITFAVFSVCFLLRLLLDLPLVAEAMPTRPFSIEKALDIVVGAGLLVSCGLVLHSLLASVQTVEQESQAKEFALRHAEASEQRLRAMFDAAKDAVFVKDCGLRYTQVNRSMSQLVGRDLDYIVGKTAASLFDQDVAEIVEAEDMRVLRGDTVDTQIQRKIGGSFRTLHVVKVPMRDDAGEVNGLFGIVRDISERKRTAAELQLAQFALDRAVDFVLWVQRDGSIVYANDAARQHMTNDAVRLQQIWDIDARFTPASWEAFWETAESSTATYETEFISTNQENPIEMEVRAYRFLHGESDLICMFIRDITERKKLQGEIQQRLSELSHLSRMQIASEMVAGMAHELNQPLAAVANYSHIIAATLSSDDSAIWQDTVERKLVAEKATTICSEALRAGEIIRRLRDLVNKREPQRGSIDLNRLVQETLRIFDSQWADSANPVKVELCGEELIAQVDEIQIQQVILNLLANAKDAVSSLHEDANLSLIHI